MVKYIFCIIIGAFLTLGFNHILNDDLQKCPIEAGTMNVQPRFEPDEAFEAVAASEESYQKSSAVTHEELAFTAGDLLLCNAASPRLLTPLKTIRTHESASVVQFLSSLGSRLHEKRWKRGSEPPYSVKSAYRYFVYTLRHILR